MDKEGDVARNGWKARNPTNKNVVVVGDDGGGTPKGTPVWFAAGHLQERLEGGGGHVPQLGMRTETTLFTAASSCGGGATLSLTGHVTWVEAAPAVSRLGQSDSLFWRIAQSHPHIAKWSPERRRQFLLDTLGCLHGQRIKSISCVTDLEMPHAALALRKEDLLEITYQFDDAMFFPWVVTGCRLLSSVEKEQELPPFFYQYFEGCPCPRCELKAWQTERNQKMLTKFQGNTS